MAIRGGKLKMTWAKPPDEARAMGIERGAAVASVLEREIFDDRDGLSMSHGGRTMRSRGRDEGSTVAFEAAVLAVRP